MTQDTLKEAIKINNELVLLREFMHQPNNLLTIKQNSGVTITTYCSDAIHANVVIAVGARIKVLEEQLALL